MMPSMTSADRRADVRVPEHALGHPEVAVRAGEHQGGRGVVERVQRHLAESQARTGGLEVADASFDADSTPFRSPIPRRSDQPFQGFPITTM
jgi:hypothetical protein